jgi:uncharacterized spore protein YtfJ
MDMDQVLDHARDAMTVKRVFGDPYERDGLTIIPVANVMGGAGAGGGTGKGAAGDAAAGADAAAGGDAATGDATAGTGGPEAGYGMGYGVRATPAGIYVIKAGDVAWKPALDMNRLTAQRAIVLVVGLLVFRSIVRTLVKR